MQNRTPAVMQQRAEARDSLDDFPTPPWAVRALLDLMQWPSGLLCHEPAAGRGHMARTLAERFQVWATDVQPYPNPVCAVTAGRDYLLGDPEPVDLTITNPPFRLAEEFVSRALTASRKGVAMFVRSSFTEGSGRYRRLFSQHPPLLVAQFCERVVLHKGRIPNPNVAEWKPKENKGRGAWGKPSTATSYCWIVWDLPGRSPATFYEWFRPGTRARLERPGDYSEPHDFPRRPA